jgi:hypothetical protein
LIRLWRETKKSSEHDITRPPSADVLTSALISTLISQKEAGEQGGLTDIAVLYVGVELVNGDGLVWGHLGGAGGTVS